MFQGFRFCVFLPKVTTFISISRNKSPKTFLKERLFTIYYRHRRLKRTNFNIISFLCTLWIYPCRTNKKSGLAWIWQFPLFLRNYLFTLKPVSVSANVLLDGLSLFRDQSPRASFCGTGLRQAWPHILCEEILPCTYLCSI